MWSENGDHLSHFYEQHGCMVHIKIFIMSPFCFCTDHYNVQSDDGGVNKMATYVSKEIRWEVVPLFLSH
jgi:hypothetical protein